MPIQIVRRRPVYVLLWRTCVLALIVLVFSSDGCAEFTVLNFGDSLTLQSNPYLQSALGPNYDLHSVTVNAQQSGFGVENIASWLEDPDGDPATPTPATWDIVRFNHGIWDAVPITGQITTTQDYLNNLGLIVGAIRQHSPDAKIIFSTSPLIDPNRVTLDPPPASGLVDYVTYDQRLTDFRNAVTQFLPSIGVFVDDKYTFYLDHSPSDFSLPAPIDSNTGEYWHWDGIHFDESYRPFEASRTAGAIAAVAEMTLPIPVLRVNRITGAITLDNSSNSPVPLAIQSYSITSSRGALDQSNWKSIADYYDVSGDSSVDSDDEWTKLSIAGEFTDLSEEQLGGTPGDGGSIGIGSQVVLSQGSGVWLPSPFENDLRAEITLTDGTVLIPEIIYEGNGGAPLLRSDLNHDGNITVADYLIFDAFSLTDLSGLTAAQAYLRGDLDGDFDSDLSDYLLFRSDYVAANGAGSFMAMLQAVPEPVSAILLVLGYTCCLAKRQRASPKFVV